MKYFNFSFVILGIQYENKKIKFNEKKVLAFTQYVLLYN